MTDQWTDVIRPAAGRVEGRVVVIPHAGAGPHALIALVDHIPAHYEVVGVTLPGRESRSGESPATTQSDPRAVVNAILRGIEGLPTLPTVLFGHSLGAALAKAVALTGPELFVGLVVSAYPSGGSSAQCAGRWSESELLRLLRGGGATPEEMTRSPIWRRHLLELLRGDLTLSVRLLTDASMGRLAVPVTVLCGDADGIVESPSGTSWALDGAAGVRFRSFSGDHFYLLDDDNRAAVAAEIAAAFSFDGAGQASTSPTR